MVVNPVGEYEPKKLEERILEYWRRNKIADETVHAKKDGRLFSFLEGPPTANAPPLLHHVEVRTFKDLVNRFRFMQGRSVPRKAGWDCHGLPVEVQIEKKLKLNSKKDIVKYGIDKFVEECRSDVFRYIKDWDNLTERMGYWIDMEKPYVTMDNEYIESVWWSLKELWKKKLLYEGYRVVPYCARCGTPLSSHEVAQGYKTLKENTVYVKFKVKGRDDEFFLAWTTTPWTLLSNLALAVNPDIEYASVLYRREKYVLAKALVGSIFKEGEYEIVGVQKGRDLLGREYEPIFRHFTGKLKKKAWFVIAGSFVSTEEGTGIVHIAPAFGEDDYLAGLENNLPMVNPIDEDGKFTSEIPELQGLFAKDADPRITEILRDMDVLVSEKKYEHEYPFCWRCNTPLLYYAMNSWFVKVSEVKENLLKKNKEINWFPDNIKEGRFGDWLANVRDWALSRNRFWGTPLPIWKCDCGGMEVIGSREELVKASSSKIKENLDLHRPYVDEVRIKCPDCGKDMNRVPYVIDCWYDSGAATFAQFHYPFENRALFGESFPYDFICEATDQTRGWFYTLLALSTILFDKPAYRNVVVGGLLLDDKGEKMAKSKGNVIDPWSLFNTVGADAVRLHMCSAAPWNARRFGTESLNEYVVPMLKTLWNCYGFTVRYMVLDKFDPREHKLNQKDLRVEDRWIISLANSLVRTVESSLEKNEYHHAVRDVNDFIVEDLSRWYIKLIRDRLWLETDDPSKNAAYMTLHHVFSRLCVVLAPIAPFVSEEIYLNLLRRMDDAKSVHLLGWSEAEYIDSELEYQMNLVRKIFEAGSYCRQNSRIKLRHPVSKVIVAGDGTVKKTVSSLREIILKQLNSKEVEFLADLPEAEYVASPNFSVIGPKYGANAGRIASLIRENVVELKGAFDSGKKELKIKDFIIARDMVSEIKIKMPENYAGREFSFENSVGVVYVDVKQSRELISESLARDVVRNIQELRKEHNLEEMQRIRVVLTDSESVRDMLSGYRDAILKEVRGDDIQLTPKMEGGKSFEFNEEELKVDISH